MDIVSRIRRLGFRKWYERQLIDSHVSFATCLLSGLTAAACLEAASGLEFGWKPVSLLAVVAGAIAAGWYAWRRFITVLERAEAYGSRSSCPACNAYARFEIVASASAAQGPYLDPPPGPLPYPWLRVRCRKCGTAWRMPD